MSRQAISLVGRKFGKLTVVERTENKGKEPAWICQCECGNTTTVMGLNLKNNSTKGCGCLLKTHGKTSGKDAEGKRTTSKEYKSWHMMKTRCLNPNYDRYDCYGGRGITVCDRWTNSFEAFLEDMGPRPENMELDRINNDDGYYPGNCRWADRKTQINNRRCSPAYRVGGANNGTK